MLVSLLALLWIESPGVFDEGSLTISQNGKVHFSANLEKKSGSARIWVLDKANQPVLSFDGDQWADVIILAKDPKGVIYAAGSRDFEAWGEYEVKIWKKTGDWELVCDVFRRLSYCDAFAVDQKGAFYWSQGNGVLKRSPDGAFSIVAGDGIPGFRDGSKRAARFKLIHDFSWRKNNLELLDEDKLRVLTLEGNVSTLIKDLPHSPHSMALTNGSNQQGQKRIALIGNTIYELAKAPKKMYQASEGKTILAIAQAEAGLFILETTPPKGTLLLSIMPGDKEIKILATVDK